jgi:hypothetical protein
VAITSDATIVFDALQLGTWMVAYGDVPLTTSDEVHGFEIWLPWENSPADVPQSFGLVARGGPARWLKQHPCMQRCSPRSGYGGTLPLSLPLPWWWRRTMVEDDLARHNVLQRWSCNFTCGVLCAKLLDIYVCNLWWPRV